MLLDRHFFVCLFVFFFFLLARNFQNYRAIQNSKCQCSKIYLLGKHIVNFQLLTSRVLLSTRIFVFTSAQKVNACILFQAEARALAETYGGKLASEFNNKTSHVIMATGLYSFDLSFDFAVFQMILVCPSCFTRDSRVFKLATGLPLRAVSGSVTFIFDLFDLECVVITVFQASSFFPYLLFFLSDENMQVTRHSYTMKYLLGLALGKWIVSHHCKSEMTPLHHLPPLPKKQYGPASVACLNNFVGYLSILIEKFTCPPMYSNTTVLL